MKNSDCPRCGQRLPEDAPEGLCAACLIEAGAETLTAGSAGDSTAILPGVPRLKSGETLGPYRVGRLLGRGGMGEVYECEHVESGRRVALKVLRERLENADQRGRFLREGQLAASMSHPHTVYIFGTEEITGMPVISMELLPGGTLKDRVSKDGPLPPSEAVSAILDIIGGLDAAQAAGILHRDIKPSNCFLDNEGSVKVGDFGLSISTLARDVRHELANSTFEGTPQFAAPEQLRGEALDVRADIYAVGATLFYLLTGKTPFEAQDLRELARRVSSEQAPSPRTLRSEIPQGLAAIILRCLSKTPVERPETYAALSEALRPFSALDTVPARVLPRLFASLVDGLIIGAPYAIWLALTGQMMTMPSRPPIGGLGQWALITLYYLILEGIWGASLGKRLFGLRVESKDGVPATLTGIALRTGIVSLITLVPEVLRFFELIGDAGMVLLSFALSAILLVTVRRGNNWTLVHDFLSGTCVVARAPIQKRKRSVLDSTSSLTGIVDVSGRRFGPFVAVSNLSNTETGGPLIAFDPLLRRQVWIQVVAPGTPTITPSRRDVGRPGRLFWLTGRRSPDENWDAFEAPDGETFARWSNAGIQWAALKLWLLDLVSELIEARKDNTTPELGLERLWVRNDGRLVLLDFPAPGSPVAQTASLLPVDLLAAIAARAGQISPGEPSLMPLSVRALLDRWTQAAPISLEESRRELLTVARQRDEVQRWRRALSIGLAAAPTLLTVMIQLAVTPMEYRFVQQHGEMMDLIDNMGPPATLPTLGFEKPEIQAALEIYVVGTYRSTLESDSFWNAPLVQLWQDRRPTVRAMLDRHPALSKQELADASAIVTPKLVEMRAEVAKVTPGPIGGAVIVMEILLSLTLIVGFACGIVSAAIVPGGFLLRSLGLAVVSSTGREISRLRSVLRALIAWLPIPVLVVLILGKSRPGVLVIAPPPQAAAAGLLAVLVIGAVWAIVQPTRGLHDRIVRTWITPR